MASHAQLTAGESLAAYRYERRQRQLLPPAARVTRERQIGEVGEGAAAPDPQRLAKTLRRDRRARP